MLVEVTMCLVGHLVEVARCFRLGRRRGSVDYSRGEMEADEGGREGEREGEENDG